MSELKKQLEALLFSSGRKMSVDELKITIKERKDKVVKALSELEKDYNSRDSAVYVINEEDTWRMAIKEGYIGVVQKIVTETELSKAVMETLAVIAFKYPIKQSDLINIRSNKAYDHLKELENMGYITRKRYGRTNLIKLAPKFFEYFDLPPDKIKEAFKDFESIAEAIKEKEFKAKEVKEKIKEEKEKKESEDAKVEIVDDNIVEDDETEPVVETYIEEEKLGDLEIVDEDPETAEKTEVTKETTESEEKEEESPEEHKDKKVIFEEEPKQVQEKEQGIELPKEMDEEIDKKVDEMLKPEHDPAVEEETKKEESQEEQEEVKKPRKRYIIEDEPDEE